MEKAYEAYYCRNSFSTLIGQFDERLCSRVSPALSLTLLHIVDEKPEALAALEVAESRKISNSRSIPELRDVRERSSNGDQTYLSCSVATPLDLELTRKRDGFVASDTEIGFGVCDRAMT
jgi:hypothetical protein